MPIIVSTCCDTETEADRIAHLGVVQNMAACAHVERISSTYRWKGEVRKHVEWKVSFKTADGGFETLAAMIREQHSYEEPAIYATAITQTTLGYLDWIEANSRGGN